MDAEPTDTETPKQDGTQLGGSQFGGSETQITGAEGATRNFGESVDPSTTESLEMAGTDSKPNEDQDTKNNFFALRLQKFTPIGILDPDESVVQSQMQLWKKTREELKLKLLLDLKVYKEWRPARPFSQMLVDALERDTEWRENGDYAEMDMQSLIRNAVSVPITTKKNYVKRAEHEWQ
jgi:hypothetical protein